MIGRGAYLDVYARLGLVTVPLRPREKRPMRAGWQKPDPHAWDGVGPDANVGILTGSVSGGLLVLDFDTEDGPFDVLGLRPRELATRTLVVKTARGWHVYARADDVRTRTPRPGLDLRGEGSMVVAPPSVHPSGAQYEFVATPERIARLSKIAFEPLDAAPPAERASTELDWEAIEEWIGAQAPKLRAAWKRLKEGGEEFDRSSADFAVARCLAEGGYAEEDVAAVLMALPASKAAERGEVYARKTAARARR